MVTGAAVDPAAGSDPPYKLQLGLRAMLRSSIAMSPLYPLPLVPGTNKRYKYNYIPDRRVDSARNYQTYYSVRLKQSFEVREDLIYSSEYMKDHILELRRKIYDDTLDLDGYITHQ